LAYESSYAALEVVQARQLAPEVLAENKQSTKTDIGQPIGGLRSIILVSSYNTNLFFGK